MQPTDTSNPDYFHHVVDCQWACPAHTDVPEYIRLIAPGQFTDAYMVNRESNVFPGILGRVCDRPCEPACRRGARRGKAGRDLPPEARRRRPARTIVRPPAESRRSRRTASASPASAPGRASLTVANDLLPLGYEVVIFEQLRRARRPDAHQHPVVPPARRACSTRRSATSSAWASRSATTRRVDEHEGAARDRRASTPCSSAPARPRARSSSCPGRQQGADRIHIGIDWLESVAFGHIDEDRRARADHRRRQHRDGLLPHVAAPRREGREGDGAQAARVLQGLRVGARGRRGGERRDRRQPRAEELRGRGRQARGHAVRPAWSTSSTRAAASVAERVVGEAVLPGRRRDPGDRPGERVPLDRARPRHRVRQVGRAGRRQGDVPVDAPGVFFGGDAAFGPKNIIWAVEHGHQAAISIHKHCQGEPVTSRLPPTA